MKQDETNSLEPDAPGDPVASAQVVVAAATTELAERLGLPLAKYTQRAGEPKFDLLVEYAKGRLQIREARRLEGRTGSLIGAVWTDLLGDGGLRRARQSGKQLLLAKAVGIRSGSPAPRVVDATAGLGRDAFALALLGCRVTALERSPVVAALLEDALGRARESARDEPVREALGRIDLEVAEAQAWLSAFSESERPEVICLDPMFPHKNKQALSGKEMQILQRLLGPDDDADDLLEIALKVAISRVVVKRPSHAPVLTGQGGDCKPVRSHKGKAIRFDVYKP